jgi:hypothetical protein
MLIAALKAGRSRIDQLTRAQAAAKKAGVGTVVTENSRSHLENDAALRSVAAAVGRSK